MRNVIKGIAQELSVNGRRGKPGTVPVHAINRKGLVVPVDTGGVARTQRCRRGRGGRWGHGGGGRRCDGSCHRRRHGRYGRRKGQVEQVPIASPTTAGTRAVVAIAACELLHQEHDGDEEQADHKQTAGNEH